MARPRTTRKKNIPSNGHDAVPSASAVPLLHRPRHLGQRLSLSRQSIYNLIKRGELQAYEVGGSLRVPEASVLSYLARCGMTVQP